ncbi:MAG TPA: hypothetical protein VGB78_08545 [Thermoplasmata archaeon]
MRRVMVALISAIVIGLLLVPSGASALTTMVVQDSVGDVGIAIDMKTGTIRDTLSPEVPLVKAGYFDMVSVWLSQKGKTYTFGMELAVALPKEGTPLPNPAKLAQWELWIDPVPYIIDPSPAVGMIALRYDGSSYSAFVCDWATKVETPIPFSIDGSKLQLQFTAAQLNNAVISWWVPLVEIYVGPLGTWASGFVDAVDLGAAPGQVGFDLPWPPV